MLIPVAHENLRGRRWPYVTIAIIGLNFIVFLFTILPMQKEMARIGQAQLKILLFNIRYPDATMSADASHMVFYIKHEQPEEYAEFADTIRQNLDKLGDSELTAALKPEDAQAQMDKLCADYDTARDGTIMWDFAFHPYHPKPWSYITAAFLHGGWLHIIFNMWFLWLAGTILEDAWGRVVYPIFYLVCGVFASMCHAMIFSGSMMPVVGASGAIAGLMGAFLARFPKTKIKMMWIFFWMRPFKFDVPAYVVLPLWLGIQLAWGISAPNEGGVAYWAHVGGFAFGMIGAVLIRATGIEKKMDQAIESKVSLAVSPHIANAAEWLEQKRPDYAIAELELELKEHPDSIEALELMLRAQEKTNNPEAMKPTLASLVRNYVAAGDRQQALAYYDQYLNLGGEHLPRGVWLEICRFYLAEEIWSRAADEFEKFAQVNYLERSGVPAMVSAAQIYLKQLHRHDKAEQLFLAAAASPIPHLTSEAAIQEGLKACATAVPKLGNYAAKLSDE